MNGRLCLLQGICVCDVGWTALGDYRIEEGTRCDMDITAIKVLSVVDACLASTFCSAGAGKVLQGGEEPGEHLRPSGEPIYSRVQCGISEGGFQ
jgi:hypothetical protein